MVKEKKCFKCGEIRPLFNFYKHGAMADGHLNKCKDCAKRDVRRHRYEHPDKVRAQDRAKYVRRRPEILEQMAHYQSRIRDTPEYQRRRKANTALGNAVRDGRLKKPPFCTQCGEGGRIEGHHFDYNEPLKVVWLCSACHKRKHHPVNV